jgi:hypothetical protein
MQPGPGLRMSGCDSSPYSRPVCLIMHPEPISGRLQVGSGATVADLQDGS